MFPFLISKQKVIVWLSNYFYNLFSIFTKKSFIKQTKCNICFNILTVVHSKVTKNKIFVICIFHTLSPWGFSCFPCILITIRLNPRSSIYVLIQFLPFLKFGTILEVIGFCHLRTRKNILSFKIKLFH